MKPVLEVENLNFKYPGKPVLNDISFQVFPGEFLAVIGPNGCGKTTLIKNILKNIMPAAGRIRILGQDIALLKGKGFARKVAAVLQTIDPCSMTVREYVMLGRLPFFGKYQFFETQSDADIAQRYMELTGVAGLAHARVNEISGGERQLAAIARALAQEPSLLVMDEPTSHLDITHQVRILDLMNRLRKELKLTVLMVLHDLNLASEYSDRLVLLDKSTGTIFNTGTPASVLTEEAIKAVYRTRVKVSPNPITQKPWIFLVSNLQESENKNPITPLTMKENRINEM